ncbi:MAG: sigma-70 family RNA polymerase sigma factor [Clostridia bacterium]|nr:sigma-70 family RNA polymerase sigma factor [Clostridia bacterium]
MAYTDEQMRRIIAEYGPCVYRLAMAQLRNQADAEDTYQEVFLRLIRSKPEFESPAHQKAWFIRVTANYCRDLQKKHSRRELALMEQDQQPAAPGENAALSAALDALPEKYRTVVHLYYYEGYTTEEIAHVLEMNASTVRSSLKRARKRLKDFMEGGKADV